MNLLPKIPQMPTPGALNLSLPSLVTLDIAPPQLLPPLLRGHRVFDQPVLPRLPELPRYKDAPTADLHHACFGQVRLRRASVSPDEAGSASSSRKRPLPLDSSTETELQSLSQCEFDAARAAQRSPAKRRLTHADTHRSWGSESELWGQLRTLGFTDLQLYQAMPTNAVAKTYRAVLEYSPKLLEQKFTHTDILEVANNPGSSQALAALIKHTPALICQGFGRRDIVRVAGNGGGARALRALVELAPALVNQGFERKDLVEIARNSGAAQALAAVARWAPTLLCGSFSRDLIVSMASCVASAQKIILVGRHHGVLAHRGIQPDEVVLRATDRTQTNKQFEAWILGRIG